MLGCSRMRLDADKRCTTMTKFKIFCVPGDHRDDFESLERQLNEWSESASPEILHIQTNVTAMTDIKNSGRYLMSALVAYK